MDVISSRGFDCKPTKASTIDLVDSTTQVRPSTKYLCTLEIMLVFQKFAFCREHTRLHPRCRLNTSTAASGRHFILDFDFARTIETQVL